MPKALKGEKLISKLVNKNLKDVGEPEQLLKEVKILFKMRSSGKF